MGQVQRVNSLRTYEFNPSFRAEFLDVTTKQGHSYIGVQFDQLKTGGSQETFRTDLSRLEEAAKQAREYAESGDREQRVGSFGDLKMRMYRGSPNAPDQQGEAMVDFAQKARDGKGEWQRATTRESDLATTVQQGKELEQELGRDKRWFVLVGSQSVERKDDRIYGDVARCFDSEEKAQEHLGKSSGLALYAVPQSRGYERGESIELWGDARLRESRTHESRSVEDHLERVEFDRGRMSDRYIVARWNDVGRDPEIGMRAEWSGASHAYNGAPQDFKAGPTSGRDPGRREDAMYVLIERGEGRWSKGTVVGFSSERPEMTAELASREAAARERGQGVQHGRNDQQAANIDWAKQSFTMDRDQFTQGRSM